jgi:glycyl-tRNA synthetase
MYGMDAAILMNQNVWKASGHVAGFADPLVEDLKTKKRFRADHLLEAAGIDPKGMKVADIDALIKEKGIKSPDGNPLGEVRQFNMMLKTSIGAIEDDSSVSYLRPETAGGMFVNFKNIVDSFHPRLPFGMAQIGKAFRNEIAPRDFIFRVRELEQMEIEYFIAPSMWEEVFESFRKEVWEYTKDVGLSQEKVHELEVADGDRAHYSKRTIDFEFDFPFGRKELYGLAYRTDFDLKAHTYASKTDLSYYDEETKERFIPHVIEPSFGVGRTLLAVLSDAYTEDELGGESRTYLKFSPKVAPMLAAVFPLLKNKPELVSKAREVYSEIRKAFSGRVMFDDNGNIGKRYRRQDEIGTPYCITVDFDTIEKDAGVTIRNRDTGQQERMTVTEVIDLIAKSLN